jgi:hypothetical protein
MRAGALPSSIASSVHAWPRCYTLALVQLLNLPRWNGEPFVVGDLFVLKKGDRAARCALQTHALGLELRLSVGAELLQSLVCRTEHDVLNTFEQWKASMQEKGWR